MAVVFHVMMVFNGPKHYYAGGCVILKFSEDEFLSLLAELKVKSKFLLKVIKIKCLKQ